MLATFSAAAFSFVSPPPSGEQSRRGDISSSSATRRLSACSDDDSLVKAACDADSGEGKQYGATHDCAAAMLLDDACELPLATGVRIDEACCASCSLVRSFDPVAMGFGPTQPGYQTAACDSCEAPGPQRVFVAKTNEDCTATCTAVGRVCVMPDPGWAAKNAVRSAFRRTNRHTKPPPYKLRAARSSLWLSQSRCASDPASRSRPTGVGDPFGRTWAPAAAALASRSHKSSHLRSEAASRTTAHSAPQATATSTSRGSPWNRQSR